MKQIKLWDLNDNLLGTLTPKGIFYLHSEDLGKVVIEVEPTFTDEDAGLNMGVCLHTYSFECPLDRLNELKIQLDKNYFDFTHWALDKGLLNTSPIESLDYTEEETNAWNELGCAPIDDLHK